MKNYLIFLILLHLILCNHLAQAQSNALTFGSDTTGLWEKACELVDPCGSTHFRQVYKLSTEVISADGQAYRPLGRVYNSSSLDTIALYRQDGDQVYTWKRSGSVGLVPDTGEILIYDYALVVGDTFFFPLPDNNLAGNLTPADMGFVVNLIDSVQAYNGVWLRQWHFDEYSTTGMYNPYINIGGLYNVLEKIGTTNGWDYTEAYNSIGGKCNLVCFYEGSAESDSVFGYCSNVGMHEYAQNNRVTVFPNPSSAQVNIACADWNRNEEVMVEVVGLTGQSMVKQTINSDRVVLDVSAWTPGIYMVLIHDPNGIGTKRLVVE